MTRERLPNVFAPFRIGPVDLRNRIFVPAHTTNFGADHLPSDRHARHHTERACGGVGLIIFEAIRVHPRHRSSAGCDRRRFARGAGIPAVVEAVHAHGVKL